MALRAYVYIDGENHCTLAESHIRDSSGVESVSEVLEHLNNKATYSWKWPANGHSTERYLYDARLRFFWDRTSFNRLLGIAVEAELKRAIYATAIVGDAQRLHDANVKLREYGFEAIVLAEEKNFSKQRKNLLDTEGVLQKPKGCDMALVTRMVSDAALDLYDICVLFTSDSDFLPAVKAVRSMGKIVWVHGHRLGLMKKSEFLHVPDEFLDLGALLESDIDEESKRRQIWKYTKTTS